MNKKIYKYELSPDGVYSLPVSAVILSVGTQGESIYAWAEVDPSDKTIPTIHLIRLVATGGEAPNDDYEYLNTVFYDWMVFHAYVLKGNIK